jgi:hypothetical protein
MAESGERRMLFDVRGRRKHVIRVVYAVLALLMGGSLFLTVGPFNISELIGTGGTSSAAAVLDEQAERIERRLVKKPTDETLLLSLTRTKVAAGNAQIERDPASGATIVPTEAKADFEAALDAWHRYLKRAGSGANPSAAQLIAATYFSLAESGETLDDISTNIEQAAEAQQIVARARPSVGSLSTLAIYEYFNGDFAAGDKAAKEAERRATTKSETKAIEKQLTQYRKRGKSWVKQKKKFAKLQKGQGKEALQNPVGGFSGGSTVTP